MAKKGSSAAKEESAEDQTPAGYEQTSAPRGAQTWVKFAEGLTVQGRLVGRFSKKDKKGKVRWFYRFLAIGDKNKGFRKPDKDSPAEEVSIAEGEPFCVDEKASMKCLQPKAMDGGVYNVVIKVIEEVELDNDQTYWDAAVYHKLVGGKPRPTAPAEPAENFGEASGDDIPF